jgi:hypothetical protein
MGPSIGSRLDALFGDGIDAAIRAKHRRRLRSSGVST